MRGGVVTVAEADDAGVPAVEVRKFAARGALHSYGQGVYTHRRVRRALPEWMELENRPDVPAADLTHYEGIPATTVHRALEDMRNRMPPHRWAVLVAEALRKDLIGEQDASGWKTMSA